MPRHGDNIWKRNDGRWEARFLIDRKANGKAVYCSVYAKTYTDVKRKREEKIKLTIKNGTKISTERNLESVIIEYLDSHKYEIKQSTYARYIEIAEKHLIPDLGTITVSRYTSDQGNEYVRFLLSKRQNSRDERLAVKTVRDIISVLKLVLKYAESKKYIINVPFDFSIPKQVQKPIHVLTNLQFTILTDYVCTTNDSYKFGVYLCLNTGLRIGEICALQWKDIDFNNATISVNKTVLRVKNTVTSTHKTQILVNSPKTPSSKRVIPLPQALLDKIMQLKNAHTVNDEDYFLTGTSKFIEPRNYYEKYKRYLKCCGLDHFTFHTLRHTFATKCIEANIDPKVLSEILGHSSVQISLNRYVHPSLEAKRNCLERLFER